jgi:transposase
LKYAFKKILPQILDRYFKLVFIQNNVGIHYRKELVAWLKEKGYKVLEWLPYSPNLNLIKYVWVELKKLVYKLHLELYTMEGPENTIYEKIKVIIYEV